MSIQANSDMAMFKDTEGTLKRNGITILGGKKALVEKVVGIELVDFQCETLTVDWLIKLYGEARFGPHVDKDWEFESTMGIVEIPNPNMYFKPTEEYLEWVKRTKGVPQYTMSYVCVVYEENPGNWVVRDEHGVLGEGTIVVSPEKENEGDQTGMKEWEDELGVQGFVERNLKKIRQTIRIKMKRDSRKHNEQVHYYQQNLLKVADGHKLTSSNFKEGKKKLAVASISEAEATARIGSIELEE